MFVRLCFAFAIICNFHFVSAFIYGTRDVVTSLSPFADSNLTQWQAQRLIYDFLLIEEPGQRDVFSPGLAKSWKISENQKIFDFELRDAFWSDNTRVTSEDVKFSLEHILDDHYKSSWKNSFTLLEKIEIISPTKIRIFAKKVNFEFWKNLAVVLKIIPKRFYLDPKSKLYNKQALGSGPYKIVLLNPSQKNILLEKNKTWWGWTDPRLKSWYKADQITFQSVGNDVVARNYFQKNLIDIYPLTNSFLFQELTLSKKYLVYLISDPNQQSKNLDQIFFNLKNSLFNDKKIREALNQLFDRKTSCPKIYGPFEISLPQSSGHALATFKNAGWTDSDKDGVLDKTIDGKRQPFEFEIMYDKPESEAILTTLKEVFKSFGIRITLKNTDSAIFWKVLNDKKFQAYFNSQDLNETVLGSEWRSTGYYNNQSFNNPRVDKALDQLDITFDAQKRQNLIDTIRVNISAEFPSLVLCQTNREKFAIKASHPKDLIKKGIPLWGWFEK